MKGVVSYTLFGDNPMYTHGAIRNCQIWKESDFDVDLVFYLGKSVSKEIEGALLDYNATTVRVDYPEDQTATFWRYEALDLDYHYYLFRDCDSRPYEREFICIEQWLKSEKSFHIIRDHPFHGVKILAGLFGVRADWAGVVRSCLPSLPPEKFYQMVNRKMWNQLEAPFPSNDFYQVDQWWLGMHVYHQCRGKILAHDDFFGFERTRDKHAPPPRDSELSFMGEGFDENDNLRFPDHRQYILTWPHKP